MRKALLFVLALSLLISMQIPTFATGMELSLSDKTADQGQMVYVTVVLTEPVVGKSVAITFTYDEAVLVSEPEKSSWSKEGLIQDFGMLKDAGVWTVPESRNLQGEICVLAFRVLPEVAFANTKINFQLIIKDSSETVAEFTEAVILQSSCEHDFGEWEDHGEIGHTQRCKLCGASSTQSHTWDKGTVIENETSSSFVIRKFTCTSCGAIKTTQIDVARPNDGNTDNHPPQENTPDSTLRPTVDDHDHPGSQPTTDSHGHTHNESQPNKEQEPEPESVVLGVVMIGISLAIMSGAILYFVLKNKKAGKR